MKPLQDGFLNYSADTKRLPDFDAALIEEHGLRFPLECWRQDETRLSGPYWKDVDLMDLPDDLRRGTMVADFDATTADYFIRYWGEDLVMAFGIELSQWWLSKAEHNGVMNSFVASARQVIETAEPLFLVHEVTSPSGIRRRFPVLRMPLFNQAGQADKIMTVENIQLCISKLNSAL